MANLLVLKWRTGLKAVLLLELLLAVWLMVSYIFLVNSETKERYSLWRAEQKIADLAKENQNLLASSLQENAEDMQNLLASLNFEKTEKVNYIKILNGQMVVK